MTAREEAPIVTVAVVSWNTRDLLVRCLASLETDVESSLASVWVVDNGSDDGSAEAARQAAPWAEVVEPGRNLGFGGAINLVAARTRSPWIAAANADVALEPGALDALLAAGGDKRVACVAPRLLLPDGETQHSVYPFPTLAFTAYLNLGLPVLTPGLARWLCLEGFWDPEQPREVPWAIGACLLLRRAAFEEAGAFDEASWMYAEDLDLGWRLRDRGWVTRYEPAARVRHHAAAATAPAFGEERTARFMAATYATIRRRRGGLAAWAVGVANVCGAWVRVAWMAPLSRLRPVPWQHRRNENRRWLRAHRTARHTPARLLRAP